MSLTANAVAFWRLNEASGAIRYDSIGSNNLADNATVAQIAGIVGKGAHFTRTSSQYLSIADNADLSTGDIDFTFAVWVYLDTKNVNFNILGKWEAGDQREYLFQYETSIDRFRWVVNSDGGAASSVLVVANNYGAVPTGTWVLVIVSHDASANTIDIQVNDGAIDSLAHTLGVFDGTSTFKLSSVQASEFFNGRMDAIGFWKKVLSADERTEVYNNGNGMEYPFTASVPFGIIKPSFNQIASLEGSYLMHPRYQGCVGHWFMGDNGGVRVHDISETGNHGVLTLADTTAAWAVGQFGITLDLDGTNDYVVLDAAPLTGAEHKAGFTIMGLFNAETIPASNQIIYESGDSDWTIMRINVVETGGNKKLRVWNRDNNPGGESFAIDSVQNIVAGILYHFAITYDGVGNWIMYINGLLDQTASSNISGTYNMNGGAIGARPPGVSEGNESWDGFLDEIRTYNRAKSANEVLSHFLDPYLEFEPDDVEYRALALELVPPVIQSRISIAQP